MQKNWGVRLACMGVRDRGVNRDRGLIGIGIGAGDEHIIPFEKHPPPPPEKKTN